MDDLKFKFLISSARRPRAYHSVGIFLYLFLCQVLHYAGNLLTPFIKCVSRNCSIISRDTRCLVLLLDDSILLIILDDDYGSVYTLG